jgi:hypothetical protein
VDARGNPGSNVGERPPSRYLRRVKRLLPLLCFLGCATPTPPVTPAIPTTGLCGAALAQGDPATVGQACGGLFARAPCQEAWKGAPDGIVDACAASYCPDAQGLAACAAEPRRDIAAVGELFDAALRLDDPRYNGRLGPLLAVLVTPVVVKMTPVTLPKAVEPGNVEALRATVAVGGEQLVLISALHPDGLVLPWSAGSESVRDDSLNRLQDELVRVRAAYPEARNLILSASDDVEYGDIIALMDAVRSDSDGVRLFDHVTLAVSPGE